MFKRAHHQKIVAILQKLDHEVLCRHCCYFGGGTAITLLHDEYRESVDIDFLVSDLSQYRSLRSMLTSPEGLGTITVNGEKLLSAREIRADQYGIRTLINLPPTHLALLYL